MVVFNMHITRTKYAYLLQFPLKMSWVPENHFIGCNNGGGGGFFLKVKRLVLKCIATQKRLFPEILAARVGCSRCHNFLPRHIVSILQQDIHIFIVSPVHRLLESAMKLQMQIILGAWRIVWSNFGGILLFGAKRPAPPDFLLNLKTAFFEAHLWSS